jgi:chorismate mutase-like protein
MAQTSPTLDDLRMAIDRMDKDIHDLLMERIAITDQIAAYKNQHTPGAAKMRPGREAVILRKLVERHGGALSEAVLARIWREIMSAVVNMQEPFRVRVADCGDPVAYWDLARFHYGTQPHALLPTALDVLDACRADKATVGVVPAPQDGEDDPWWVHMHGEGEGSPRVFGRLPFLEGVGLEGMGGEVTAYTIGQVPLEASGDDLTWLVIETVEELSRSRVLAWAEKAGLKARMRAMHSPRAFPASFYLLEVDGFLDADAEALQKMRAAAGKALGRLSHIGIIARPIHLNGA